MTGKDARYDGPVLFCGECQQRVEAAGCEWFSSHLVPRHISESSHPTLLPDSPPPVVNMPLPETYSLPAALDAAARLFRRASEQGARVLICAGAGISVDSGVPDFRGPNGFNRVDGQDTTLNDIDFHDPAKLGLSWGKSLIMRRAFRQHAPHKGYLKLLEMLTVLNLDYFVLTSNIDGYFMRAGFDPDRLYEVHGSTDYLQCPSFGRDDACTNKGLWPMVDDGTLESISLEATTNTATDLSQLPRCACGRTARPHVSHVTDLDENMVPDRKGPARKRLTAFIDAAMAVADEQTNTRRGAASPVEEAPPRPLAADARSPSLLLLEIGSGASTHGLREETGLLIQLMKREADLGAVLIRIDPGLCEVPEGGHVALNTGAESGLCELASRLL